MLCSLFTLNHKESEKSNLGEKFTKLKTTHQVKRDWIRSLLVEFFARMQFGLLLLLEFVLQLQCGREVDNKPRVSCVNSKSQLLLSSIHPSIAQTIHPFIRSFIQLVSQPTIQPAKNKQTNDRVKEWTMTNTWQQHDITCSIASQRHGYMPLTMESESMSDSFVRLLLHLFVAWQSLISRLVTKKWEQQRETEATLIAIVVLPETSWKDSNSVEVKN